MVNDFLRNILYKLHIRRKLESSDSGTIENDINVATNGFNGILDVETVLLFDENQNVVLNVDYDFMDMPAWVEGNAETKKISVVQLGGDVAELTLDLPESKKEHWMKLQNIVLVTRFNTEKLMHNLSFVLQR